MYTILKNGLTACGKVWKEGERISDETAKQMGFDKWFESLEENARQRSYVLLSDSLLKETPEVVEPVKENPMEPMLNAIATQGLTLDDALKMKWQQKVRTFGVTMAKKINDYGKSISTK